MQGWLQDRLLFDTSSLPLRLSPALKSQPIKLGQYGSESFAVIEILVHVSRCAALHRFEFRHVLSCWWIPHSWTTQVVVLRMSLNSEL